MHAQDVLEVLDRTAWDAPFTADEQSRAIGALEAGRVVCLPHLAFPIAAAEEKFLAQDALDNSRKNISLDPATGKCQGAGYAGAELTELAAMLDRYGKATDGLVRGLYPGYAATLRQARTSFRPAEISGRQTSPRHDDRRLHVDAFPTRPMHGQRILRVFNNVAPDGVLRQWRVGEDFENFARLYAPKVRAPLPGQFALMELFGLTKGRRSAYDHLMLGLHDTGKLDDAYQARSPHAEVAFAPGTTWMCFTDSVLHAAMSGRCAFEQTFHIPVSAMAHPEKSPLRVLERLTGKALV